VIMSQEIREFVAGDKFTITTTLEHEANLSPNHVEGRFSGVSLGGGRVARLPPRAQRTA